MVNKASKVWTGLFSFMLLFFIGCPSVVQAGETSMTLVDLGLPIEVIQVIHDNSQMSAGEMPPVQEMTLATIANLSVFSLAERSAGKEPKTSPVIADFVRNNPDYTSVDVQIQQTVTPDKQLPAFSKLMAVVQCATAASTIDLTGVLSGVTNQSAGDDTHLRRLAQVNFSLFPQLKRLYIGSNHLGLDVNLASGGASYPTYFFTRVLNDANLVYLDLSSNELSYLISQNGVGTSLARLCDSKRNGEGVNLLNNPELLAKDSRITAQLIYYSLLADANKIQVDDAVMQRLVNLAVVSNSEWKLNEEILNSKLGQLSVDNLAKILEREAQSFKDNPIPGYGNDPYSHPSIIGGVDGTSSYFLNNLLTHYPELVLGLKDKKPQLGGAANSLTNLYELLEKIAIIYQKEDLLNNLEKPAPQPPQKDTKQSQFVFSVVRGPHTKSQLVNVPTAFNFKTVLLETGEYTLNGTMDPNQNVVEVRSFHPRDKWQVAFHGPTSLTIQRTKQQIPVINFSLNHLNNQTGSSNFFCDNVSVEKLNSTEYRQTVEDVAITFLDDNHQMQVGDQLQGVVSYDFTATAPVE